MLKNMYDKLSYFWVLLVFFMLLLPPFLVAMTTLGPKIEKAIYPVASGFVIDYMGRKDNILALDVYGIKNRACTYKGVTIQYKQNGYWTNATYTFRDAEDGVNRPPGRQAFGKWDIEVEYPAHIRAYSTHKCTGLWDLQTELFVYKES